MNWRKWNNIIHRDLGYLCFGLTIIYAISGLVVNHIRDWNSNYKIIKTTQEIQPVIEFEDNEGLAKKILNQLNISEPYNNFFRSDTENIAIYFTGKTINANFVSGNVVIETVQNRPFLREANFLHLNEPKKVWTLIADIYAVSLGILAITGILVIKGKKGITGRGAWLTGIGIVIPIVFLYLYHW